MKKPFHWQKDIFLWMGLLLGLSLVSCTEKNNGAAFLRLHTEAADSLLAWMRDGCPGRSAGRLALYPAAQLADQILQAKHDSAGAYGELLRQFNPRDSLSGAICLLNRAYRDRAQIDSLLQAVKRSDFGGRTYARVMALFPPGFTPRNGYDVFLTATGWQWGDAMTIGYTEKHGTYRLSEEGTPAMLLNLTIINEKYGDDIAGKLSTLSNVVSHELFHALLSDFARERPEQYPRETIGQQALYKLFNEGLAHYTADGTVIATYYDSEDKGEWMREVEQEAFSAFADSLTVINNPLLPDERRNAALTAGLYGSYWSKYVCVTGLFMAYHIEQQGGQEALKQCVESGPAHFVEAYRQARQTNPNLPAI